MSSLKNPGLEPPMMLDFDNIPSLKEFLRHGGIPGCSYLFVAAKNQPRAQVDGWHPIIGVPFFNVGGIGSTLMARGKPLKDTPAQPGTARCPVFADDELLAAIKEPTAVVLDEKADETQPQPASARGPKHAPTNQAILTNK